MSNLSELLPAGSGAKVAEFVASGTLASGQTVALKTDGTVEAVSAVPESAGSSVVFEAAYSGDISSTFDSVNNKVVVVYRDNGNSDHGTAVVGTVSGTSISFGTPVVFNTRYTQATECVYDSTAGKIVIAYGDWASASAASGTAIVGTVSGTSISFGTAVTYRAASGSNTISYNTIAFDSTNNKVVICYRDGMNSNYGTAIVGTVSGTSISFGSAVVFESAATEYPWPAFDSTNNKVVIAYQDTGNSSYGTGIVGTVSGTSISFGTAVVFATATVEYTRVCFDASTNKTLIAYSKASASNHGTAVVATVSGTAISFGSPVTFNAASTYQIGAVYSPTAKKTVITYRDVGNSGYGTLVNATISGTSVSFSSEFVFSAGSSSATAPAYDSNTNKVAIAYRDQANSNYGTSIVYTVPSSNNTDFLGITNEAISNSATGEVAVQGGVSDKLSGLTVGADYYVQADGSISSPTVSFPYVIDGATFIQSFSVSAQDGSPHGIAFNTDGTKMFFVGISNDNVYEYDLSTGFDISTSVYSQAFSVASQDSFPRGLAFNSDGTKMFVSGDISDSVFEYTLSTGFDISTASYSQSFSVSAQDTTTQGIAFNTDGTKMYIVGQVSDAVYEYTLSTGFNISTASYSQSFSVASQDTFPNGIAFSSDGTKMFITGNAGDDVNRYLLSTAFDVSTASFSDNFSVASQDSQPQGVAFSADGTKMFVMGSANDSVYEYSTGGGPISSVPAGRALSTTSILLEG